MVSKHGLEKWLARHQTRLPQPDDENPGVPEEVSISDILCEHGALDPSKASDMKCINEVSAQYIIGYCELDLKIRVLTTKSWQPDATSRHYFTLTTSVRFASPKRIKVRVPPMIARNIETTLPLCRKAIPTRAPPLGIHVQRGL